MKNFFKNPVNVEIVLISLAFVCFVIAIVCIFYDMSIDHYCIHEISVTDAMREPVCRPYIERLIK